jgi:hypothetical protein
MLHFALEEIKKCVVSIPQSDPAVRAVLRLLGRLYFS